MKVSPILQQEWLLKEAKFHPQTVQRVTCVRLNTGHIKFCVQSDEVLKVCWYYKEIEDIKAHLTFFQQLKGL